MKKSQLLPRRIPLCLCVAAMLLALSPASAMQLTEQGCIDYAVWSGDLVWAREIGADRERTRASLVEMYEQSNSAVMALLLRDFDRLWATRSDRLIVMRAVARDCLARGGRYEDAT